MTATAAPEGMTAEEKPVEESRPPVTQVVEIIEEDITVNPPRQPTDESPMESKAEEPTVQEKMSDELSESARPGEEPKESEEPATRKSMVEELYSDEKKTTVMPEISMHRRGGQRKSLMVWAVVTIIVALLTGGILFAASRKGSGLPNLFVRPTPTPTSAPTPTPTPTPAAVDKATFSIQVLNGGGTPGAAGKMKSFLVGKGYKVSDTGNTPDYTYDTTEIHGKSTMTDAVANLKADLKDDYTLGTVASDLDASASADVQVIVGK